MSETVRSIFECVFSLLTRVFISRVVWGGILVLLVVLVLPQLVSKIPASFGTQQQGYLSLLETFTELKELRSKRVDEGTWREFQERSEDKLAKMLPNLERNAKSSDPVSMSLLRIARDYLPRLLNDQERLSTEAERTIEAHLMVVKNGTQVARSSGASWDVLATLMVGLDILGACVAFGYFGYIVLKRVLPGAKHR